MRMALDLGLHRALDKLAEEGGKHRTEEEERDLGMFLYYFWFRTFMLHCIVVSARIWLCLYWFDHQ